MAWQREALRAVYGNVDLETGLRKYRTAYVTMAKKNGKSFLVAGIPIYHMVIETQETKRKAFGAASSKLQAGIVFEHAFDMVNASKLLKSRIKLIPSTRTMAMLDGSATYRVLACVDGKNDGIEPSLNMQDEIHEWKDAAALKTYQNMVKGTRSREEPLTWQITTAGEMGSSPLWQKQDEYAKQILNGSLKSDRFYAMRFTADPEKNAADSDYWKSREARVAANPSHEDLGGFLKDAELVADLEDAINKPAEQPAYLRYTLNLGVSSATRYLPADKWQACGKDQRAMIGRRCIVGLDLSERVDLTALVLLFPSDDGTFDVLAYFWMPGAAMAERERKDRVSYSQWAREGLIEACEGPVVSYRAIRDRLDWCKQNFNVTHVAYDPWHATQFVEGEGGLVESGYACIKIGQGTATLSEPTKRLLEAVVAEQIRHGNNPVLNWMADCAASRSDGKDNVVLVKPDRGKETKRIDGIAALVNAFGVYVREESTKSVYEERGILSL